MRFFVVLLVALFVFVVTLASAPRIEPESVVLVEYEYNWCEHSDEIYDYFWRYGFDACEIIEYKV